MSSSAGKQNVRIKGSNNPSFLFPGLIVEFRKKKCPARNDGRNMSCKKKQTEREREKRESSKQQLFLFLIKLLIKQYTSQESTQKGHTTAKRQKLNVVQDFYLQFYCSFSDHFPEITNKVISENSPKLKYLQSTLIMI